MIEQLVDLAASCFLVVGFVTLLYALKLIDKAGNVIQVSRSSLLVMGDPLLSDYDKEKRMQASALKLLRLLALLSIGGFVAVALPAGLVWAMDRAGWLSFPAVVAMTLDWRFLLGTTVVAIITFRLRAKQAPTRDGSVDSPYAGVDRLLHATAFATAPVQRSLAHLEDRLYRKILLRSDDKPVYITGLPRSGTTLLLELLYHSPEFSTHTYRNMPFLLIPLLWNHFASSFRSESEARERAHRDGMTVSPDSPEAFEEIIWMQFWPEHYHGNSISPWNGSSSTRFEHFYRMHRRMMALLKEGKIDSRSSRRRYVSKNNLNIARVQMLLDLDTDARIIIPFRNPYQHAASLLRQHLNFSAMHEKDGFARQYMADIGHFDFGLNLKPVNFDNWLQNSPHHDPTRLSFWLSYWAATYGHQLAHRDERIMFSDFDSLCEDPIPALSEIAEFIGVDDRNTLLSQASRIRPPSVHDIAKEEVDDPLKRRVGHVLSELKRVSGANESAPPITTSMSYKATRRSAG